MILKSSLDNVVESIAQEVYLSFILLISWNSLTVNFSIKLIVKFQSCIRINYDINQIV